MSATKFKNNKSFTATNTVRSAATITVLVFCLSAARGENLTTLDGRTFTNVVSVTNYPSVVIITHEGGESGVKASNLPENFRAKYGIIIKTNPPTASVPQIPIDPTNSFLWQNTESQLYELECTNSSTTDSIGITKEKQWCIHLRDGVKIILTANTTTTYAHIDNRDVDSQEMELEVGQEELVSKIFNKFIDWDTVAAQNHAENFEKEIARRPMNQSASSYSKEIMGGICIYTFSWEGGKARLHSDDDAPYTGYFDKDDIMGFQKLLELLPDMKGKLVAAIRNKEAQKDLFK